MNSKFLALMPAPNRAKTISKTAAAPLERIKLLIQNQDEMVCAYLGDSMNMTDDI